jgi:hypothetical protein
MQMKSGVALQPRVDAGMLVRPLVVDDEVQVQIEGRLDVDELEKPNKFLMPSPRTLPSSMLRAAKRVVVPWRL